MAKTADLHGPTWHLTVDPLLDEISRLNSDRRNARLALGAFLNRHPEFETDPLLLAARLDVQ